MAGTCHNGVLHTTAHQAVRTLLEYIGENPDREGLQETPARFVKALREMTSGYQSKPEDVIKMFEDGAEDVDEMVVEVGLPIYSQCEHHILSFFGVAHIGYLPNKKIVGLSKLPRLLDIFARRLQVQERLTTQVSNTLWEHLKPKGVGVVLECRHMCMECRGVRKTGSITRTSAMRGVFRSNGSARAEFLSLINARSPHMS